VFQILQSKIFKQLSLSHLVFLRKALVFLSNVLIKRRKVYTLHLCYFVLDINDFLFIFFHNKNFIIHNYAVFILLDKLLQFGLQHRHSIRVRNNINFLLELRFLRIVIIVVIFFFLFFFIFLARCVAHKKQINNIYQSSKKVVLLDIAFRF